MFFRARCEVGCLPFGYFSHPGINKDSDDHIINVQLTPAAGIFYNYASGGGDFLVFIKRCFNQVLNVL